METTLILKAACAAGDSAISWWNVTSDVIAAIQYALIRENRIDK